MLNIDFTNSFGGIKEFGGYLLSFVTFKNENIDDISQIYHVSKKVDIIYR